MTVRVSYLIHLITLVLLSFGLYYCIQSQRKIAYVRSSELVYSYVGMHEAHKLFESKQATWKANIDTLDADWQRALSGYQKERLKLNEGERKKREEALRGQQQHLVEYTRALEEKAKEEDARITQGVLNQVNQYVERYGKEHGYDIILGTTVSGNLLFAKVDLDITKEVLEGLNKSYRKPADED